ncbi:MAG: SDR family oxidoreductase [Lachnospiraceae bacterium]
MNLEIQDKIVFITASTKGIGYATAKSFLAEGAKVIINGRNQERLIATHTHLSACYGQDNVFVVCGDMTKTCDIEQAKQQIISRFGKVDILIPNLGSGKPISENRLDMEEWARLIDINLYSAVKLIQIFLDILMEQQRSSIVLLSSLAACEKISAPYAYAAAKNAILTLTKYMAIDYAEQGIRVNAVVPGNIIYPTGRWEELLLADEVGTKSYIEQNVPMKRFGKPEEIADMIVFLASERASFMTGNTVVVDGGQKKGY